MKKNIFLIIILLCTIIIPSVVFAKEYCEVVSGTGRNLGDEIACGSEHFYLLSNENNKIKMLAKYYLYTGYIIDRVPKQDGNVVILQEKQGEVQNHIMVISVKQYM